MTVELSSFAKSLTAETAFTVLAIAKELQATGKDAVELEIGDSPFNTYNSGGPAPLVGGGRRVPRVGERNRITCRVSE